MHWTKIKNNKVASALPDLVVFSILESLKQEQGLNDMGLLKYTLDFSEKHSGQRFSFSMDIFLSELKWLTKNGVVCVKKAKRYFGKGLYATYFRGNEFDRWHDSYTRYGKFPIARKLDYAHECRIRQHAINKAIESLELGDVENAILLLKNGSISGPLPELRPFFELEKD